jgi:hypothetical protein
MNPEYYIKSLGLEKHPEGGWFKEVYRSEEEIAGRASARKIFRAKASLDFDIFFAHIRYIFSISPDQKRRAVAFL